MRSWAEGLLALLVIASMGLALFLFTGMSPGGGGGEEPAPVVVDPEAAARGAIVADTRGCLECHSIDGSGDVGPTWKGIAGSERPLTTGEFVPADDAYLFGSIIDPNTQLVQGYEAVMPGDYGETLSEQEIDDLVAYIKSLAS